MLDPKGWHHVKPLKEPSLSLMLTRAPHKEQIYDHDKFGKDRDFKSLSKKVQAQLLKDFTYFGENYIIR